VLVSFGIRDEWVEKMDAVGLVNKCVLILGRHSDCRETVLSNVHLLHVLHRPCIRKSFDGSSVVVQLVECSSKYLLDLPALQEILDLLDEMCEFDPERNALGEVVAFLVKAMRSYSNEELLQRVLNLDYGDPVPSGQITSLFGARNDPLGADTRFHYGLDIAGEEGTVISAFADGTVTALGNSTELGKYVTVAHDGGYSTLYAHCAKITASDGQQVKRGDPIAEMGDTGRATGFHLHFELHQDNTYLNPIYYVTFS